METSHCFFCPICFQIPENEIFQCKDGHTLCASCYAAVSHCPQCRVPFGVGSNRIRCRALESLLDTMSFNCTNEKLGCTAKVKRGEMNSHLEHCLSSSGVNRLCQEIGYKKCNFELNPNDINNAILHLETEHGFEIWNMPFGSFQLNTKQLLPPPEGDMFWIPSLLCLEGNLSGPLFVVIISFNKMDNSLSVGFISLNASASDYEGVVVIKSASNKIPDLRWTTPPTEFTHPREFIRGEFFRVPVDMLRNDHAVDNNIRIIAGVTKRARFSFDEMMLDHIEPSQTRLYVTSTTPTSEPDLGFNENENRIEPSTSPTCTISVARSAGVALDAGIKRENSLLLKYYKGFQ